MGYVWHINLAHHQLVHAVNFQFFANLVKSLFNLLLLCDTQEAKGLICQLHSSFILMWARSFIPFLIATTSDLLFIASHDSNVTGLDQRLDTGALCQQQFLYIIHQLLHLCCVVKRPVAVALCNAVHSMEDDWKFLKDMRHFIGKWKRKPLDITSFLTVTIIECW